MNPPVVKNSPVWDDNKIERLRTMWAAGKSASEIASALGDGISRCAVIGKCHRLKLPKRPSPIKRRASLTQMKTAESGREVLTCRWLIGDVLDHNYCGARCVPGRSWCPQHCEIVFVPRATVSKDSAT